MGDLLPFENSLVWITEVANETPEQVICLVAANDLKYNCVLRMKCNYLQDHNI